MSDPTQEIIDKDNDGIDDRKQEKLTLRMSTDRWKNRRRMAWTALVAILCVTYLALFKVPLERLAVLKEVITWFYFVMGSIVGAYVGFATLDDIKSKKA